MRFYLPEYSDKWKVPKGGALFHHGATLHSSHRNKSDQWRRAYALHFTAQDAVFETKAARELQSHAYFRNELDYVEKLALARASANV